MKTDLQWSGQTWGFPGGTVVKNLPANKGDAGNMGSIPGSGGFHPWVRRVPSLGQEGSIPGSGRFPGEGNGNPLQYSCLGNPMDRGAWRAVVRGVAKS